jgi:hypothetical protein
MAEIDKLRAYWVNGLGVKHGLCGTRIHGIYKGMMQRCQNKNSPFYFRYGGRGINICEQWSWKNGLATFAADMLPSMKDGMSIGRIDNDKGYSPENCRWETPLEQANNTARNRMIEYNGKRQSLSMWARELGVKRGMLKNRLLDGWSVERAFSTPRHSRFSSQSSRH